MSASHNPPSIIDSFCLYEQTKPNALFLSEPVNQVYQNFTWQSAGMEIRKMVTAIHSMGLKKGDKIAILSKNCAHWVMADLAIMMAGCVSVPLYPNISSNSRCSIGLSFAVSTDDRSGVVTALPLPFG